MQSPTEPRTALITGASRGIGMELTKLFARRGYQLVLAARDESALNRLADDLRRERDVSATILAFDLADPAVPEAIMARLLEARIEVDVLVNNAGFGTQGRFWETDLQAELQLLQVNITSLTHLTRLILPGMVERRHGRVMNVASTAAFYPGPLMAVYYASKAYVLSLSLALAEELRGRGVTVTALCPGPTRSGFQERAGMADTRLMRSMMDAETVARIGYEGLMRGEQVVIPGRQNVVTAIASRFVPATLAARIVRRLNDRPSR